MADALVIFKPDASHRLAVRRAMWDWLSSERSWKLRGLTWFQPPEELVKRHYDFLEGRPFFPWLVDFMTALPLLVGSVEAEPTDLEAMRFELGETRIHESRPGSLRERYGIYGGINCLHLSDSPETGARETEMWRRYVDLEAGHDRPEPASTPDHTFHLRSLFAQVDHDTHVELATQEIKKLLREETDLDSDGFEALCRILLGALS